MPGTRSLRSKVIGPSRPVGTGPPSPTMSESTNISAMHFGAGGPDRIITRANLKTSVSAYEKLISSCASYRAALIQLSTATASFADAMQMCSSLKGPSYEAGTRMGAASGLHHLMSNHWHIIAETCDREFEKPLRQHLNEYKTTVGERSASYEKTLDEKSQLIRQTEISNLNKKGRNLQSFREALTILQRQVDELDDIKAKHYQEIIDHEEAVWTHVQAKTSIVVRSTMDVFDRLTSKASDPVIEHMLQAVPDPFDVYGTAPATEIFTILPPLSIIAQPGPSMSASPSRHSTSSASEAENSAESAPGSVPQSTPWTFSIPQSRSTGFFTSAVDTVAAWANTAGASSLPQSPSTSPPERSPSPDGRIGATRPRRSGSSGLRNVLSAIDESASNGAAGQGEVSNGGDTVRANAPLAALDLASDGSSPAGGWLSSEYAYGQTPYMSIVQEAPPRRSTLFAPAGTRHAIDGETPRTTSAGFFDNPDADPARSISPLSNDTAVPIST